MSSGANPRSPITRRSTAPASARRSPCITVRSISCSSSTSSRELGVAPDRGTVVDLGCGTGVAGAAVATSATPPLQVIGIDTHPWTLDEARFTYQAFGLTSDVRRGHAARTRFPADTSFVVAAFVVNELKDARSRGVAAGDPSA